MRLCRVFWISVTMAGMLGCANMSPQEAGYMLGAIAGGTLASAPGAMAGALLGTAAGALIAKPLETARQEKERQTLQQRLETADGATTPSIAAAPQQPTFDFSKPQRIWIDEQLMEGRVIPGHFTDRFEALHTATSAASTTVAAISTVP